MPLTEKWKAYINESKTDDSWHKYDDTIKSSVKVFNRHLSTTPGYKNLDWKLIKAMTWTESGAGRQEWKTQPIQIGNPGDSGLQHLYDRKYSDLIIPKDYRDLLADKSRITSNPVYNIRAGIAYLLLKMATFKEDTVLDKNDTKEYTYKCKYEIASKLAKELGTTLDLLKKTNSHVKNWDNIPHGTELKYKKAKWQLVISGWRAFTPNNVYTRYNVGDSEYADKLKYCLSVMDEIEKSKSATK